MSKIGVVIDGHSFNVELNPQDLAATPDAAAAKVTVVVDGVAVHVVVPTSGSADVPEWIIVDGRPYEIALDSELTRITALGRRHSLDLRNLESPVTRPTSRDGRVKAPIPGLITRVLVRPNEQVATGQPLFILEAMKMENEIRAPRAGLLDQIRVDVGKVVTLHEVLAEIV